MLIHCTMDELIAIRDGEGSLGARRHLDDCEGCRDELERLHQRVAGLKALRSISSPRDRWPAVRDGVVVMRRRRRMEAARWVALATAASMILAAGLSRVVPLSGDRDQSRDEDPIVMLTEEARQLNRTLRVLEPKTVVLNGRTAAAIAMLEDRIFLLDSRLAEANLVRIPRGDLIVLMRQRNSLLDALVEVHVNKSTYFGF